MSDIRILASGLGFPEGPVAMADGFIIPTESNGGRVMRVDADGKATRLGKPGGRPDGLVRAGWLAQSPRPWRQHVPA